MNSRFKYWTKWLQYREEGNSSTIGTTNEINHKLYSSILPRDLWDPQNSVKHTDHGGVFNLEFSPDGSLLVAATERKSILLFDPLNHRLVNSVDQAHNHCVNYARFLDSRMFATCSDDTTVALWDVRYLKNKICSLKGHSNWVKNIEFASNCGLLVTSGFDGSIYTWDINRYSEGDIQFQRVFHTNGLMRMRLSPDNTKMIICTTGGYLMIIHNLDLSTLACDLQGFKPNMYRLMQMGNTPLPIGYSFNHLFKAPRNRVELISDFPQGNDTEVISSLQIHPHGWCALSRNTSSDENSEWTCVHDIQETKKQLEELMENSQDDEVQDASLKQNEQPIDSTPPSHTGEDHSQHTEWHDVDTEINRDDSSQLYRDQPVVHIRFNYGRSSQNQENISEQRGPQNNPGATVESFRFGNIELQISQRRVLQPRNPPTTQSSAVSSNPAAVSSPALSTSSSEPSLRERHPAGTAAANPPDSDENSTSESEDSGNNSSQVIFQERPTFFIRTVSELRTHALLLLGPNRVSNQNNRSHKIYQNAPRLTHYIEEPNVGRGFIKELCFSTDGSLICSPYGCGLRLLAFSPTCCELCDCVPEAPAKLYELATSASHSNYVVSTRFSPTHCLVVSGCLNGRICFHQPLL